MSFDSAHANVALSIKCFQITYYSSGFLVINGLILLRHTGLKVFSKMVYQLAPISMTLYGQYCSSGNGGMKHKYCNEKCEKEY